MFLQLILLKRALLGEFFSSRRRHTRCVRDWSSDVCSSDLRRFEEKLHGSASQEKSEGRLHDQRGGGAVQAASADVAPVRARGIADAFAFAGKYAAVYGSGPGAARGDSEFDARAGCEPGGNRNYSEHAR